MTVPISYLKSKRGHIMKNFFKQVVLGILIAFSINYYVTSGTIDPLTPDSKYIEYAKDFHCLYKVCGTYKDGTLFCASAVAINKNWALTAAHVVKNSRICIISKEEKAHLVKDTYVHKDFDESKFGIADIALLYIEDDFELDFYPPLYEDSDEVGKVCSIGGYGMHGNFLTGANKHDDKARAGSNIIDSIQSDLLLCSPSKDNTKTSLEYIICTGDSGGGLFIGNKLAGINSCVLADKGKKPNSSYGNDGCHTRVSKFVPWIKEIMENHKSKKPVDNPF